MVPLIEKRAILFLIEVGFIYLFTLVSLFFLARRYKLATGNDPFANRTYVYVALVVALVVAVIRTVYENEKSLGRAVF